MNILKYKKFYLLFSAIVLIPGIISLAVNGLDLSIDFTGGSIFEYSANADKLPSDEQIKEIFSQNNINILNLEHLQDKSKIVVKTEAVNSDTGANIRTNLENAYGESNGLKQVSFETIGPSVGAQTTKNAIMALFVASIGIVLYIAYSFRNIPKPYSGYRFGLSAIAAMLHDAFLVLGVFSILGYFFKVQIDSLFITAVLTVIGFSVHDSIVVFDRIRENLKKFPKNWDFEKIVNYSIVETLNRSIATSLTVLIPLFSLFVLGGESLRLFVLALLLGIFSGTYSSIFTASPLLVIWEEYRSKSHK